MKVIQDLSDCPSGKKLVPILTHTRHEEEGALGIGLNHLAGHRMVGRSAIKLLESRVYLDFFTGFFDNLDNIGRNIIRLERTTPNYVLRGILSAAHE